MPGTRQRRTRGEGERLRAELVAAAIDLLLEPQPLPAPSLRAIARACGVAPSAVYMHFASQDALNYAVIAALFGRLRADLDAADPAGATPAERLDALLGAYLTWAESHPGAYQLLFERPDPLDTEGEGPGLDLLDRLARLLPETDPRTRRAAALRIWCAVHGVASLRIHKPSAPWADTARADARALIASIAGLPAA
ncbi:TetR/AcrR family transcriptional regulator [Nocardia niigatensis]|uniref:TetR/AcrR family transcriptional regulator n=1 Tax=Nocardia niigatensis TaxID=209249 RepID=UPI000303AB13|nr:TetR/AcrR family transcriptional regulator [Nocardia niigatensis]